MNTCPNCGKMAGLHGSILPGCMCQYSMQAPPQRTWVNATTWRGLTDDEIDALRLATGYAAGLERFTAIAEEVEAKLKEKNAGCSTPPPPQRPRVVFPTMLRKMWSGSEVQAWLDENVNKEKNNG